MTELIDSSLSRIAPSKEKKGERVFLLFLFFSFVSGLVCCCDYFLTLCLSVSFFFSSTAVCVCSSDSLIIELDYLEAADSAFACS